MAQVMDARFAIAMTRQLYSLASRWSRVERSASDRHNTRRIPTMSLSLDRTETIDDIAGKVTHSHRWGVFERSKQRESISLGRVGTL